MRKILLLLFATLFSLPVFAQLEIKPNSFKEVPGFVNINTEKMYDDNDQPYAVLKIRTEKITDKQRRELLFQGDARTFFEVEYQTGEVWLYISYYASYIKISHPDMSSVEFYFPSDMKPKHGYEVTLISKWNSEETEIVYNYLTVKADQPNSRIFIDDVFVGENEVTKELPAGETHEWRIECEYYHTENGTAEIPVGDPITVERKLRPAYGYVNVTSSPENGAKVYIDGNETGLTPLKSIKLKSGDHTVRVVKGGFDDARRRITVSDESDISVSLNMPIKYKFLTLNASMNQYNDMAYGLTIGSMKRFGWFASVMTSFKFDTKYDYECDENHYVTIDGTTYYPQYTDKGSYTSLSVMGGFLMRISGPMALRVGVGYGIRMQRYETSSGYWVKDTSTSAQGIDLSLGLQGNFRGFVVSVDGVTTGFNMFEIKIGLGLGLKNK